MSYTLTIDQSNRAEWVRFLTQASKVGRNARAFPLLGHVYYDPSSNNLTATDLSIWLYGIVGHDIVSTDDLDPILLPTVPLRDAIRNAPKGGIDIAVPEGNTTATVVGSGGYTVTLPLGAIEDWPVAPTVEKVDVYTGVDHATLAGVALASSRDQARPILNAVTVQASPDGEGIDIVTTDSYRLHHVHIPDAKMDGDDMLVDHRVFAILKTLAPKANVAIGRVSEGTPGYAYLQAGGYIALVRTIQGTFPKWRNLLPSDGRESYAIDPAVWEDAAKTAGKGIGKKNVPVIVERTIDADWNMSYRVMDGPSGTLRIAGDGPDEMKTAFNPKYLADAMAFASVGDQPAAMTFEALKPNTIQAGNVMALVMPVRI